MTTFKIMKVLRHQIIDQLIDEKTFNSDNIVFGIAEERQIPGSNVKFQKIMLYYEHEPDVFSPIYLSTPADCYSFGVQEQKSLTNKDVVEGYSMAICVYNIKTPSAEEIKFMEIFDKIVDKCKRFLLSEDGEEQTQRKLAAHQLDKLASSMNYPLLPAEGKKKRLRDPNKGPVFYPKLRTYRDQRTGDIRIDTVFLDMAGNETTQYALEIYRQHVRVQGIIVFESIYLGATDIIRIQTRLQEARVAPINKTFTRFLASGQPNEKKIVLKEYEEESEENMQN